MPVNGTVQTGSSLTDPQLGPTNIPSFTINVVGGVNERLTPTLASGFNQFTIPAGASMMWFVPPLNGTNTYTLKGVTGDTGLPLGNFNVSGPILLSQPQAGSTTFGITALSADTFQSSILFI
jgi:hypothetical protein